MSKDPFLLPKWKLGIETFKTHVRVSRLESKFELKTTVLETRDLQIWSWDSVSTIQDQKIPKLSSLQDFKTSRLETLVFTHSFLSFSFTNVKCVWAGNGG